MMLISKVCVLRQRIQAQIDKSAFCKLGRLSLYVCVSVGSYVLVFMLVSLFA